MLILIDPETLIVDFNKIVALTYGGYKCHCSNILSKVYWLKIKISF